MLGISNSSVNNNSIFRRINPSFKFIIFILSVLMFFVPTGFFGQIILVVFMIGCISLAKLSKKTYINLFKTFIIMVCLFILLNWITNKTPIGIYLNIQSINSFGNFINPPFLINPANYGYENSNIYIAPLLGNSKILSFEEMKHHIDYFMQDANFSSVQKWLNSLNTGDLAKAMNALGNQPERWKQCLLYILNSNYEINGVEYNIMHITNLPQDWIVGKLLINMNGAITFTKSWYSIGYFAFFNAINVSLKIMMIICASIILTSTTSPSELTNGIEKIFSPLKIIKFPANQMALILSIGIRFIPSLLEESRRILNAQASRGLDFYNGNLWIKIRALISLVIPLFSISINRSYDLANAMDARGFNPEADRTKYRIMKLHYYDFIYLSIVILIASFLLFLWCYKFVFLPFGIIEVEMVL